MNIYHKKPLSYVYDNPELNSKRKKDLTKASVNTGIAAAITVGAAVPAANLFTKALAKRPYNYSTKILTNFGNKIGKFAGNAADILKQPAEALESGKNGPKILNKAASVFEKMKKNPLKAGVAGAAVIYTAALLQALAISNIWTRRCINNSYEAAAKAEADTKIKAFDKMTDKE